MTFFDFIFVRLFCTPPRSPVGSDRYERRTNRVCSTHGPTDQVRIGQVYRSLRRQPSHALFLHLRTVSDHGFFAQLTYRESLRDIATCLHAVGPKLYQSGLRHPVARSTLADANEKRDWRIFADFAQVLIQQALTLYSDEPLGVELQRSAYALDSTTIDLCLFLPVCQVSTPQGCYQIAHAARPAKQLPTVISVSTGKAHDVNILNQLSYEAG